MKLFKILSLFICLAIGNARAYWGQSYVESFLATIRNLWSKNLQPLVIDPYAHQKEIGMAAVGIGGLGLASYVAWKYGNQDARKNREIAQIVTDALKANQKGTTYAFGTGIEYEGSKDIHMTMEVGVEAAARNGMPTMTIRYTRGAILEDEITDPNTLKSMTVRKIREIVTDKRIQDEVNKGLVTQHQGFYQNEIAIPYTNIRILLRKGSGENLIMTITDGKKSFKIDNPDQMRSLTIEQSKRLLSEK